MLVKEQKTKVTLDNNKIIVVKKYETPLGGCYLQFLNEDGWSAPGSDEKEEAANIFLLKYEHQCSSELLDFWKDKYLVRKDFR